MRTELVRRRLGFERLEVRTLLSGTDCGCLAGGHQTISDPPESQLTLAMYTNVLVPGDYNNDNVVTGADFLAWQRNIGSTTQLSADGNRNGIVDGYDLEIWRFNYNRSHSGQYGDYHPDAIIVQTSGVTLPNGTMLNIAGSQTHGIQEAINESWLEGYDVFVLPGTYTLNAHLDVPSLQIRTFRFEDVTLNFTNSVTDYGIKFDSSMMLDWYWKGGALNAPNAVHGVLFDPESLHLLDGLIYGSRGTVETRAIFATDISAQTHKVTMNTVPTQQPNPVSINDSVFYFQNVSANEINKVGPGFASDTIVFDKFPWVRSDDPIPWDLFSPAGRVTVRTPPCAIGTPSTCSYGKVYKPDGTVLSVPLSTTSAIQEAINHAAANNLDLLVFGRGVRGADPTGINGQLGLYSLSSTLNIPNLNSRKYIMYSVTLNWGGSVPIGTAIQINDMMSSHFEITGQVVGIVNTPSGPVVNVGVSIKPTSQDMKFNIVRIQQMQVLEQASLIGIHFDTSLRTIEQNQFHFHEVNDTKYGIIVANPGIDRYFRNNLLRAVHIHDYDFIGLQLGQSIDDSADRIQSNTLEVGLHTDSRPADVGLQVFGDYNGIEKFSAYGPGLGIGVKFEPSSQGNSLFYGTIQVTVAPMHTIKDYGSGNQFFHLATLSQTANLSSGMIHESALFTAGSDVVVRFEDDHSLDVWENSNPRYLHRFANHDLTYSRLDNYLEDFSDWIDLLSTYDLECLDECFGNL